MTASSDPLVEQAARAIRDSLPHRQRPMGAPVAMPFMPMFAPSTVAEVQYTTVENEDERARRIAEAVLAVVVPLVERDVRERIGKAVEALPHGPMETGVDDGQGHYEVVECFTVADVRRVVSRDTRSSDDA